MNERIATQAGLRCAHVFGGFLTGVLVLSACPQRAGPPVKPDGFTAVSGPSSLAEQGPRGFEPEVAPQEQRPAGAPVPELGRSEDDFLYQRGRLAWETGQNKEGMRLWRELIMNYPASPRVVDVYIGFGDHYFVLGRAKEAGRFYEKAASMPDSPARTRSYAWLALGRTQVNQGEFHRALSSFVKLILAAEVDDPNRIDARRELLAIYPDVGLASKAEKLCARLSNEPAELANMLLTLGNDYVRRNQVPDALILLSAAHRHAPHQKCAIAEQLLSLQKNHSGSASEIIQGEKRVRASCNSR